MTDRSRRNEAALRPVGGVEEIQVVGAISDRVVSVPGLRTEARSVWLHPDVVSHVEARRRTAPGDAEFVLQNLAAAVLHPLWVGVEHRDGNRFRLVHLVEAEGRYLLVALKLVPAAEAGSDFDEIWVSSAFPVGERSLTRLRKTCTLKQLGADN